MHQDGVVRLGIICFKEVMPSMLVQRLQGRHTIKYHGRLIVNPLVPLFYKLVSEVFDS